MYAGRLVILNFHSYLDFLRTQYVTETVNDYFCARLLFITIKLIQDFKYALSSVICVPERDCTTDWRPRKNVKIQNIGKLHHYKIVFYKLHFLWVCILYDLICKHEWRVRFFHMGKIFLIVYFHKSGFKNHFWRKNY